MEVNSLGETPDEWRAAYSEAVRWFVQVGDAATEHLEWPGLGVWSVHELIGHISRALSTVDSYVDSSSQAAVAIPTAVAYFEQVVQGVDHSAVADRARQAAEALGDEPMAGVRALADRVVPWVGGLGDPRCATPFGVMLLSEYLPSRTFELVVHTCDLAAAIDHPADIPEGAGRSALRLAAGLAAHRSPSDVLRALTGRTTLPVGYTVLS
jgi:hypothetical protein